MPSRYLSGQRVHMTGRESLPAIPAVVPVSAGERRSRVDAGVECGGVAEGETRLAGLMPGGLFFLPGGNAVLPAVIFLFRDVPLVSQFLIFCELGFVAAVAAGHCTGWHCR